MEMVKSLGTTLVKVKSMQISGTETIRPQTQSSKPKREITITIKLSRTYMHIRELLAVLSVTSSSMCTALERVLPRYVNLSTTCFCPFTVMVGSLFTFQVLAGVLSQSFLC